MAWLRWAFLLCACVCLSPVSEASEKGRLRTITYVLRPGQSGTSGSRRQSGGQQQQQQQQRTFNVELNTRYSARRSSTLERTRRMSKASGSGASVQLRLGPSVQLQRKPAQHTPASFSKAGKLVPRAKLQLRESNSSVQVHPKSNLQQLQG